MRPVGLLSLLLPVTLPPSHDGPAQRTTSGSTGEVHPGRGGGQGEAQ